MARFSLLLATTVAACLWTALSPVLAEGIALPKRETPRPQTTNGVPHVQIGIDGNPELSAELLRRVDELPGVNLGPTRVSLPGATGFQLENDIPLAQPEAIVGGREFAHLHPDGSLHASLAPETARAAVAAGWAVSHPWSDQREGWEGFIMIYTPVNDDELDMVFRLVQSSYSYVTGRPLPE